MLNYRLPSGLPAGSRAAWSRLLLLPLSGDLLTPFSYSVLAEIAGRAWYQYYDALGFDPMPRARVMRQHNGRAYFNLTLSAQREGEQAAIEPITFIVDGAPLPVAKVEKGGFLAGIKAGRNERKVDRLYATMASEMPAVSDAARAWYAKIGGYRWTQAEILMVMEEIEPLSVKSFMTLLAARQGLLLAVNRLMRLANQPPGETLRQIDRGLSGGGHVVEAEIARRLAQIGSRMRPEQRAGLDAVPAEAWEERLSSLGVLDVFRSLLAEFGHHAVAPAEVAGARWSEDPAPLLRTLANPPAIPGPGGKHAMSVLLEAVPARERKAAQDAIEALGVLIPLQSQALDALSLILAGTRTWAWGAAHEAMSDHRLAALDDVFFYELEELKEMMTGEWNISDRSEIQNTAQKRKAQYAVWRAAAAPDLLIGDAPAESQDSVEPSVVVEPALYFRASSIERATV